MSNKLEPLFGSGKRSAMECSRALATLGFNAWNDLEPGKKMKYIFKIKPKVGTNLNANNLFISNRTLEGTEKRQILQQCPDNFELTSSLCVQNLLLNTEFFLPPPPSFVLFFNTYFWKQTSG